MIQLVTAINIKQHKLYKYQPLQIQMRDSFQKSLDGSSQFLYMNGMEASLVGQSQKIAIPNTSFINRQLQRDRKIYKQMHAKEDELQPIQQESANQFLNVGKWKDKKNKQLQQEIRKIKEKTNFLQSSIFSKMKIQDSPQKLGSSRNKLKELENSSVQVNKWKKKSAVQVQVGRIQQKIQQKQKKGIKSKLYSQNKSKYSQANISKVSNGKRHQQQIEEDQQLKKQSRLMSDNTNLQQIVDQGAEKGQQQQQDQQDQGQDQDQQQDQEQDQQEQQQQEQDQQGQQEEQPQDSQQDQQESSNSQQNQQQQPSQMQSSTSDLTFQTKEKYYDKDKQLKTKYAQQNFDQQSKPVSKWNKKSATIYNEAKQQRSQTGFSKTKYDDSFVSNREIKHDIEEQIETNPKQKEVQNKQLKPIPKNWSKVQKILLRIQKLVV